MVIATPKYQVSAVIKPSLDDVEWGDRGPVFQQSSKVWAQNLHSESKWYNDDLVFFLIRQTFLEAF